MMVVDENCKWANEDYTFEPGTSRYMPKWKAIHFAKHLVNRELLRLGHENDTSPKRPSDNPFYMELFNKAVIEDPNAIAMTESKSEEEAMNLNKDMEIAALRAENERLRASGVKPPVDAMEEMVPHTITEEDIKANPGIENDVKPGDEVLLSKPAEEGSSELKTPIEDDEDEEFEGLSDVKPDVKA